MTKIKSFLLSHITHIATYAMIIVVFTHNVLFEREVACTCQHPIRDCWIYITLPVFTIMFLLLWMNKVFMGSCRTCSRQMLCDCRCRGTCVRVVVLQTLKALLVGLLWVVYVFFEGDWFACCKYQMFGLTDPKGLIHCKDEKNRTPEEQIIVDDLKNLSKIIGLGVLSSFLFLALCFSAVRWKKCCNCSAAQRSESSAEGDCCQDCICSCDGFAPYELIIIKEGENIVNQILKEKAKEALTQNVEEILNRNNKSRFIEGFDAAEELMTELWPQENQPSGGETDNEAETQKDVWKFTFPEAQQISLQLISKPEKKDGGASQDEAGGVRSSGGNRDNPPPSDPAEGPSQHQETSS